MLSIQLHKILIGSMLWSNFHFKDPQDIDEIYDEIIWYNSHIKTAGKIILPIQSLVEKGIFWLRSITREDGQLMNFAEFSKVYELSTTATWLWFQQLTAAIPQQWKKIIISNKDHLDCSSISSDSMSLTPEWSVEYFIDKPRVSHSIYQFMLKTSYVTSFYTNYGLKWFQKLNVDTALQSEESYLNEFKRIYHLTNVTSLRDFQYRMLLGKIFTNNILYKWCRVAMSMLYRPLSICLSIAKLLYVYGNLLRFCLISV